MIMITMMMICMIMVIARSVLRAGSARHYGVTKSRSDVKLERVVNECKKMSSDCEIAKRILNDYNLLVDLSVVFL